MIKPTLHPSKKNRPAGCRALAALSAVTCAALWTLPATVSGQIYVANQGNGTIGEYTTAGATVNA